MIPKSGYRFSEKIMLKQPAKAKSRFNLPFRFGAAGAMTRCAVCRFFTGAPAALERAIPGLNILSSAYGSVHADSGLCERHDFFTTAATPACPLFEPRLRDKVLSKGQDKRLIE
jgi:hypothetical protein